jgi:hypothetical protein
MQKQRAFQLKLSQQSAEYVERCDLKSTTASHLRCRALLCACARMRASTVVVSSRLLIIFSICFIFLCLLKCNEEFIFITREVRGEH